MENVEESLEKLHQRKAMAELCLKTIADSEDPRAPEARKEYQRQLQRINERIELAERMANPPAIVVGLKSATLNSTVEK